MQNVIADYRILSHVSSEIEEDGDGMPFLVVLSVNRQIIGYVREDWKTAFGDIDELSADWLDQILDVLRLRSADRQDEALAFFTSMEFLSTGPLRTTRTGRCLADELNLQSFSSDEMLVECSQETFAAVVNDINTSSTQN